MSVFQQAQMSDNDISIPESGAEPITYDTPGEAIVWGFMGGNGGAGVTSLCVQLAYELSQGAGQNVPRGETPKRPRVCLFDLDFENGACAPYLDVSPKAHLEDLLPQASFVDRDMTESLMSSYSPHLDILAIAPTLNGNGRVDPDKVLALMDNVCQMYDYVILDIPRLWAPWTHAAIGGSDQYYFVTELTVPALKSLRNRISEIEAVEGLEDIEIDIIINKHERRSFRNSIRVSDAEKATGKKIFGSICTNVDAVREAINRGEPASVISGDSRYAKDCREMLELLLKETVVGGSNQLRAAL